MSVLSDAPDFEENLTIKEYLYRHRIQILYQGFYLCILLLILLFYKLAHGFLNEESINLSIYIINHTESKHYEIMFKVY